MAEGRDKPMKGRVWVTSIAEGQCKSCQQPVIWVQFCKSGKKAPLDRLIVLSDGVDETTRLKYQVVSLEYTHFASCPNAKTWSRRGRSNGSRSETAPAVGPLRIAAAIDELKKAQEALRLHYREAGGMQPSVIDAGQAVVRAMNLLKTGATK